MNKYVFQYNDTLNNIFAGVENVFTKEECEKIISMFKNFEESKIGSENLKDIRKSQNVWLENSNENKWIYERMESVVRHINEQSYGFDLTGFTEPFQLTKYEKNGKYGFHIDAGIQGLLPRKMSMVVQLSNENDYEGGELNFFYGENEKQIAKKSQGSVIVFPSFILHQVKEITKGTRYSLVSWVGGPPFR